MVVPRHLKIQALEQVVHSSKPEAQRLAQRLLAEMAIS